MSAGIVDHETHTRDIRSLGGLVHVMPISATLALIAARGDGRRAALQRLPVEGNDARSRAPAPAMPGRRWCSACWPRSARCSRWPTPCASASESTSAVEGRTTGGCPPARPAVRAVAAGCDPGVPGGRHRRFSAAAGRRLVERTAQAVVGGRAIPEVHLAIWHGFTPALGMSLVATLGGVLHGSAGAARRRCERRCRGPDAKAVFDAAVRWPCRARAGSSTPMHTATCRAISPSIVATLARGSARLSNAADAAGARAMIPMTCPAIVAWLVLAGRLRGHGCGTLHRLFALVVTSIVGLMVSLIFLQFSAPDLGADPDLGGGGDDHPAAARPQPAAADDAARAVRAEAWRDGAIAATRRPRHRAPRLCRDDP